MSNQLGYQGIKRNESGEIADTTDVYEGTTYLMMDVSDWARSLKDGETIEIRRAPRARWN